MSFTVVKHPLIEHKLGLLRDVKCSTGKFRELTYEITLLLTYEATRDLETEEYEVEGWAGKVICRKISGKKVTVIPILRAGLGMLGAVLELLPSARVSVVGLYRNEETLEPVEYYKKFCSDIDKRISIIIDPMLATGNSLCATIDMIKRAGGKKIKVISLVSAPEGVKNVQEKFPEVQIYTAALDEKLNDIGYILPGLGDAGDRLFGTK